MNTRAEVIASGGFTLRARELEDGTWSGEIVGRDVPGLQAGSWADLAYKFDHFIGEFAVESAEIEGVPLETREDAALRSEYAYGPRDLRWLASNLR